MGNKKSDWDIIERKRIMTTFILGVPSVFIAAVAGLSDCSGWTLQLPVLIILLVSYQLVLIKNFVDEYYGY